MSKTGVSSPSLATDRDGNRTKVPLPHPGAEFTPCPSATPELQRFAAGSVPHVSSALEFQGSAVSVLGSSVEQELKEDLGRDCWIKVWNGCSSGDSLFDGWSDDSPCDSGAGAQHKVYPDNSWRSEHWKRNRWHSSHWRTTDGTWSKHHVYDGWNSSHWKTTGWDQENERRHDHVESQWFTHAFFEALSVDQLINSLHRRGGDTTIFTGVEVDPGESLADTGAQSGTIDLRPFRKAEEALF